MSLRLWYWFQPWVPTNTCFNFCNFGVWLLREIQLKIFSISDFLRTLKKSMLKFCRLSRNLTQIHITTSLLVTCECWKDLFQDISSSMLHFSAHLYFSPKSFLVIRNSANVFHLVMYLIWWHFTSITAENGFPLNSQKWMIQLKYQSQSSAEATWWSWDPDTYNTVSSEFCLINLISLWAGSLHLTKTGRGS